MPLRLWIYDRRRKILKTRLKDTPKSIPVKDIEIEEVAPQVFESTQLNFNF